MNPYHSDKRAPADIFWGELAPCDHFVQIYQDDADFLQTLENFVATGLRQGEGIIVIATPAHREALRARLVRDGFDIDAAMHSDQYIALDARETLDQFMVNGWPDEALFEKLITGLLARARARHGKVRAFGEMVALMWAEGHCGATVHLEHMWTRLCGKEQFSLFCAYPTAGLTQDSHKSLSDVCDAHSRVYQP